MTNTTSYFEVKKVFDVLPVGYYIKRDVKRELSETETRSYYIPTEDRLIVSYPMIVKAIENLEAEELTEEMKETVIRTLLYHEVSHAFITPKDLVRSVNSYWNNGTEVMDIFEDERIESVLRKYYLNTNFRKLVYLMCGDPYKILENPNCTALNAFYVLVRYRICDNEDFLIELSSLIKKFSDMRKFKYSWSNEINCGDYVFAVRDFYYKFKTWWESRKDKAEDSKNEDSSEIYDKNEDSDTEEYPKNNTYFSEKNKEEQEEEDQEDTESCEDENDVLEEKNDNPTKETNNSSDEENEDYDTEFDEEEFVKELAEELFADTTDKYSNKDLENTLNTIINNSKKISKRNAGSINAYSGIFDPRSVARDDYKYFVQANRNGHSKMFSKTHINLFIDRSGSFYPSQDNINQLVACLARIEKTNPDFTFDLITMGIGDRIEKKNNREVICSGGNWLKKDIFDIFKKVQHPGTSNYNIVCFDGDAFTDCPHRMFETEVKNFKAFDTSNTVIISDSENKRHIERNCKHSKNIFTKNYVDELFKNVTTALTTLFRA